MKLGKKNSEKKPKVFKSTIVFYTAGIITALIGAASLVNNVMLFNSAVADYVTQGYTQSEVVSYLLPGQLIPGVLEPLVTIFGVSMILFAAGFLNQKVSRHLELSSPKTAVLENEDDIVSEIIETTSFQEV